MAKCQNFLEVFAIQSEWVRDAADDYLKEIRKLMDANSKLMGSLMGSIGKIEMQQSTETRPSTARTSMRAAE